MPELWEKAFGPDDRLVGLHRHVAELADEGIAGAVDLVVADVGVPRAGRRAGFRSSPPFQEQLPARSPMPLMVHSDPAGPPSASAPMEFATEAPDRRGSAPR